MLGLFFYFYLYITVRLLALTASLLLFIKCSQISAALLRTTTLGGMLL